MALAYLRSKLRPSTGFQEADEDMAPQLQLQQEHGHADCTANSMIHADQQISTVPAPQVKDNSMQSSNESDELGDSDARYDADSDATDAHADPQDMQSAAYTFDSSALPDDDDMMDDSAADREISQFIQLLEEERPLDTNPLVADPSRNEIPTQFEHDEVYDADASSDAGMSPEPPVRHVGCVEVGGHNWSSETRVETVPHQDGEQYRPDSVTHEAPAQQGDDVHGSELQHGNQMLPPEVHEGAMRPHRDLRRPFHYQHMDTNDQERVLLAQHNSEDMEEVQMQLRASDEHEDIRMGESHGQHETVVMEQAHDHHETIETDQARDRQGDIDIEDGHSRFCRGSPGASTPEIDVFDVDILPVHGHITPKPSAADVFAELTEQEKADRILHNKAKSLIPHSLPRHRYWIAVLNHTIRPKDARKEKDFLWIKGSRINTVQTIWHQYKNVSTEEDFRLAIHGEVPEMRDCMEELNFYNDNLVVFRAVLLPEVEVVGAKGTTEDPIRIDDDEGT